MTIDCLVLAQLYKTKDRKNFIGIDFLQATLHDMAFCEVMTIDKMWNTAGAFIVLDRATYNNTAK